MRDQLEYHVAIEELVHNLTVEFGVVQDGLQIVLEGLNIWSVNIATFKELTQPCYQQIGDALGVVRTETCQVSQRLREKESLIDLDSENDVSFLLIMWLFGLVKRAHTPLDAIDLDMKAFLLLYEGAQEFLNVLFDIPSAFNQYSVDIASI